jgi:outer membrane protein
MCPVTTQVKPRRIAGLAARGCSLAVLLVGVAAAALAQDRAAPDAEPSTRPASGGPAPSAAEPPPSTQTAPPAPPATAAQGATAAAASASTPSSSPSRPLGEVLDEYVREALESNLALRSETLEVERNLASLDAARARFLPELSFAARYSRADGGREIDVPLGSLLNPIYSTLNDLLAAQGRPGSFPTIEDQTIKFVREREQDTRLTVRQPIYAPAIPAAIRAQRAALEASEFSRVAFARRLKRDVTVAYLDWLKATKTVEIVQSSLSLLEENLRVNESLFRNGKITQDQVLRARAEMLAVVQQLREARNGQSQARSYVNFLRNRPLEDALVVASVEREVTRTVQDLSSLRAMALENRPELDQLDSVTRAAESRVQLARADLKPTLSLGVDAGTQGEEYEFGRGRNFGMISLVLNWKLFDGGARRAEARSARAAARQAATRRDEVALQIQLEVQQALDQLQTTSDSLATAEARVEAASAGFRIAGRKRDEGAISQVEFIDARNSLTSAELNLNVTLFDLLARQAELDYATAAGTLPLLPVAENDR